MKTESRSYRVSEGDKVNLAKWPTMIDPLYKSEETYQTVLSERVTQMQELHQRLYASNSYSVLIIFQANEYPALLRASDGNSYVGVRVCA